MNAVARSIPVLVGILAFLPLVSAGQMEATDELLKAVGGRDVAAVEAILDAQPALASSKINGRVPILLAAVFAKEPRAPFLRPEDNELVTAFLKRNPELGIHEASVLGRCDRVRALVADDPSRVNEPAASGWTPLHFAAFSGDADCVRFLIEQGADIHCRAMVSSKVTPLATAMFTRRFEVTRILLEQGADPLVRVRGGFSAMHEAALLDDGGLIQLLYDHGAELNSRTDEGDTPLDIAMSKDRAEAVALLRELGARTAEEIEAAKESGR